MEWPDFYKDIDTLTFTDRKGFEEAFEKWRNHPRYNDASHSDMTIRLDKLPAWESESPQEIKNMEIICPEDITHTAWILEVEIGEAETPRDSDCDANGLYEAMAKAKRILKELIEEGEDVRFSRLRPYGVNADYSYPVTLDPA